MAAPKNTILVKMLDRLFAGLANGPNLNCRPHSSRQRVDWTQFARLQDVSPLEALRQLLSAKQATQVQAQVLPAKKSERVTEPKKRSGSSKSDATKGGDVGSPFVTDDATSRDEPKLSLEEQKQKDDFSAQQALLTKLRGLAEDAREYEQDTGVHVLHVGFPLLSLPPTASASMKSSPGGSKRLLAPIAFVPVSLVLRAGARPIVAVEGLHDGADFLVPNEALFALLERQTGKQILPDSSQPIGPAEDVGDASESNSNNASNPISATNLLDPWDELNDLVRRVADALRLSPCRFSPETLTELRSAPRAEDDDSKAEIVPAAVLGLFPMNNQGLLRDMQAMVADTALKGPVQSFLTIDAQLKACDERVRSDAWAAEPMRTKAEAERLVSHADPCQARAVRLARECPTLVVHGPPGTGKSQTITNMIGDHLVRGERVLLVCDKRTALDVVARRLEHLGLGSLCALIHDPQHDQRNLYRQVREQLEALTSMQVQNRAESRLKTLDTKLQRAHATLANAWSLVMTRDAGRGVSFHERMGEWLEAAGAAIPQPANVARATARPGRRRRDASSNPGIAAQVEPVTVAEFHVHEGEMRDVISRACDGSYAENPWRSCVGISLTAFLQRSQTQLADDMAAIVDCVRAIDETSDSSIASFVMPKESDLLSTGAISKSTTSLPAQGAARKDLADKLERLLDEVPTAWRMKWTKADKGSLATARDWFQQAATFVDVTRSAGIDTKLLGSFRRMAPSIAEADGLSDVQIMVLDRYLETLGSWLGWFAFSDRACACALLKQYGLPQNQAGALRLKEFLTGVGARFDLAKILEKLADRPITDDSFNDSKLLADWDQLESLLDLLHQIQKQPALSGLANDVRRTMNESDRGFITRLRASAEHAEFLEDLRAELAGCGLFQADWIRGAIERVCRGESIDDEMQQLHASFDTLIDVLRIQSTLNQLPTGLRALTERAIAEATTVDAAIHRIKHQVLTDDVAEWLKSNPDLQALDGKRLNDLTREVHQLQLDKQETVRDLILDLWIGRQRARLLVATGTRLNGQGADLRRRLTSRGERAMRLRQVIAVGARNDGGDPLFDLRPIWMASPETVAQILPREPLFDVVIFDEASQCRLEEALPVLTRAKRVVIAGDPKQLPPTRFFESAVITSDNATVETEQDLFEAHQSEIEDLLTAALSLDIQESYLDVHYRSRNADLVEFSNEQFYGSRLQSIPGHPKNRIRFAPITLYPVGGIYEERTNQAEAIQVCKIVADLLRRAEPPSIGIACFNLTQRDLILEKLDEMAGEDRDFAERLVAARSRIGAGAFEGLFVKNLENVQGDERDHMIISTTYGPDKQGRFYRRFGPLGQVGGGRRLNVLVTRAREEVHLVTSIPADEYRNLPLIPSGQQPGGGWLLFSYLAYAEQLAEDYRRWRGSDAEAQSTVRVIERPTKTPSHFAREMAQLVASRHNMGSDVYWGNDGFCVDVAFHHPTRPEDRTLGLLCDGTRFPYADDPVEWDIFRMAVLEGQGWQLTRCWTPEFFRDPEGYIQNLIAEANRIAKADPDPEGIPVEPA